MRYADYFRPRSDTERLQGRHVRPRISASGSGARGRRATASTDAADWPKSDNVLDIPLAQLGLGEQPANRRHDAAMREKSSLTLACVRLSGQPPTTPLPATWPKRRHMHQPCIPSDRASRNASPPYRVRRSTSTTSLSRSAATMDRRSTARTDHRQPSQSFRFEVLVNLHVRSCRTARRSERYFAPGTPRRTGSMAPCTVARSSLASLLMATMNSPSATTARPRGRTRCNEGVQRARRPTRRDTTR